jgi:hypothetical protein
VIACLSPQRLHVRMRIEYLLHAVRVGPSLIRDARDNSVIGQLPA